MDACIGTRIATYRRRRGRSQAALAGLVGLSVSWLSQVERGVRSVDRLSVLLDLAQVLHVEVEALTSRPWEYSPNGGSTSSDLDEVRDAVLAYTELVPRAAAAGPQLETNLGVAIERGFEDYQAARYGQAVRELPAVLRTSAASDWSGADSEAYALAHVLAAKLLRKRGAVELANRCADRAALVAAMTSKSSRSRPCLLSGRCGFAVNLPRRRSGAPCPGARRWFVRRPR
jgi:transcriptional regulator with XRE-family HTH domain